MIDSILLLKYVRTNITFYSTQMKPSFFIPWKNHCFQDVKVSMVKLLMESGNTFLYITIKGIKAIGLPKIYGFTILWKILRDVVFSYKFQNKVGKNIIAFIFSGKK